MAKVIMPLIYQTLMYDNGGRTHVLKQQGMLMEMVAIVIHQLSGQ